MERAISKYLTVCLFGVLGCAEEGAPESVHAWSAAILDGKDGSAFTGVVFVDHVDADRTCSGAFIAQDVVATAKHCVFRPADRGGEPLSVEGFRVGLGPAVGALSFENVREVSWLDGDASLDIEASVRNGEDIALLVLSESAAESVQIYTPAFGLVPTSEMEVDLVGFGQMTSDVLAAGPRLSGTAHAVGWDRSTGVLEFSGARACLGDSGGPVLVSGEWVGAISQVGANEVGTACEGSHTFASTILHPRVAAWLKRVLLPHESSGAPALEDAAPSPDAAGAASVPEAEPEDGGPSEGDGEAVHPRGERTAGCSLSVPGDNQTHRIGAWSPLAFLLFRARQQRRRGAKSITAPG